MKKAQTFHYTIIAIQTIRYIIFDNMYNFVPNIKDL